MKMHSSIYDHYFSNDLQINNDRIALKVPNLAQVEAIFYKQGKKNRGMLFENIKMIIPFFKEKNLSETDLMKKVYAEGYLFGIFALQVILKVDIFAEAPEGKKTVSQFLKYLRSHCLRDSLTQFATILHLGLPGKSHQSYVTIEDLGQPVLNILINLQEIHLILKNANIELDIYDITQYFYGFIDGALAIFLQALGAQKALEFIPLKTCSTTATGYDSCLLTYLIRPPQAKTPLPSIIANINLFTNAGVSIYAYNLDDLQSLRNSALLASLMIIVKAGFGDEAQLEDITLGKYKICVIKGQDLVLVYAFQKTYPRYEIALKLLMQSFFFEVEQAFFHYNIATTGLVAMPKYLRDEFEENLKKHSLTRISFNPFLPFKILDSTFSVISSEEMFILELLDNMEPDSTVSELAALLYAVKLKEVTLDSEMNENYFNLDKIVDICEKLTKKGVLQNRTT